jgi:hypothetical protein
MSVKDLVVKRLTTFRIAADGTRFRMNFISGDGDQARLARRQGADVDTGSCAHEARTQSRLGTTFPLEGSRNDRLNK